MTQLPLEVKVKLAELRRALAVVRYKIALEKAMAKWPNH